MSDFPEGIAAPEGAQELVDVCKETWAVIQNEESSVPDHDEAVDSFEAAMAELAEMDVHVNNEGDFPVFSLGVKEAAYDSSVGFDFAHSPPLRPQSPRIGFWRRRRRKIWALAEKSRRRVYCTGLRASLSELAYVRPLSASETGPV
jgi:hypothetical protein